MKQQKNALFYIWERGDTLHYLFLYKIKERYYFFKKSYLDNLSQENFLRFF